MHTRWVWTTCNQIKTDGGYCGRRFRVPAGMWNEPTTRDCGDGHLVYKEDKEVDGARVPTRPT